MKKCYEYLPENYEQTCRIDMRRDKKNRRDVILFTLMFSIAVLIASSPLILAMLPDLPPKTADNFETRLAIVSFADIPWVVWVMMAIPMVSVFIICPTVQKLYLRRLTNKKTNSKDKYLSFMGNLVGTQCFLSKKSYIMMLLLPTVICVIALIACEIIFGNIAAAFQMTMDMILIFSSRRIHTAIKVASADRYSLINFRKSVLTVFSPVC